MKQGKRLTRDMKELLSKRGYDATKYMYVEEDEQAILFIHKTTKERIWVSK